MSIAVVFTYKYIKYSRYNKYNKYIKYRIYTLYRKYTKIHKIQEIHTTICTWIARVAFREVHDEDHDRQLMEKTVTPNASTSFNVLLVEMNINMIQIIFVHNG